MYLLLRHGFPVHGRLLFFHMKTELDFWWCREIRQDHLNSTAQIHDLLQYVSQTSAGFTVALIWKQAVLVQEGLCKWTPFLFSGYWAVFFFFCSLFSFFHAWLLSLEGKKLLLNVFRSLLRHKSQGPTPCLNTMTNYCGKGTYSGTDRNRMNILWLKFCHGRSPCFEPCLSAPVSLFSMVQGPYQKNLALDPHKFCSWLFQQPGGYPTSKETLLEWDGHSQSSWGTC